LLRDEEVDGGGCKAVPDAEAVGHELEVAETGRGHQTSPRGALQPAGVPAWRWGLRLVGEYHHDLLGRYGDLTDQPVRHTGLVIAIKGSVHHDRSRAKATVVPSPEDQDRAARADFFEQTSTKLDREFLEAQRDTEGDSFKAVSVLETKTKSSASPCTRVAAET